MIIFNYSFNSNNDLDDSDTEDFIDNEEN
jgi:hypothetical protein